jgi:uncharacterized protein (TIGR02147 family)
MKALFEYTDFREYLKDFYLQKKNVNTTYSYRIFAEHAGFRDKSCIYSVMKGNRKLPSAGVFKLCRYFKFKRHEEEYFSTLVSFNQAQNNREKSHYFEKLCSLRHTGDKQASHLRTLRREQYEYYSKWYHSMIRSLIDMYNFKNDYKNLARMLTPSITPLQAKKSVKLLLRLGLIEESPASGYRVMDTTLTTGKEVKSCAVSNFHSDCADLAKRAINEFPSDKRNITGLTMGISEQTYSRICEEIQEFQKKLISIAESDQNPQRVYQLNFTLFPTTRTVYERDGK